MRTAGEDEVRDAVVNAAEAEDDGKSGTLDQRLARKLQNDSGNGERLRGRFGRNLMCVPESGRYAWTGSHWSVRHGDKEWALCAQKTAVAILAREAPALEAELAERGDAGAAKRLHDFRQWGVQSGNQARLEAMQKVSEAHLLRHVDELDADPFLFNVVNGTLELGNKREPASVRLRRHARRDLITHCAPIGYDPDAECPLFRAFLDEVVPDPEVQDWLQRWFGYCLTADYNENKLAVLWGEGRNGKGVLTKLMQWLFGDYAAVVQFQSFVDGGGRRGSEPSPDLAKLVGARAVFASEAKKGARLDDGLIKQLTGGDPASVRKLNKDFFDLAPTFKITLICNNKPQVRDDTHGMWSRVALVPFTVTIAAERIDQRLLGKLKAEGPGILNWCLDGFRRWREFGLSAPQAILAATAEYRNETDLIRQFLDAATIREPGARVRAQVLYACYLGWAREQGLTPEARNPHQRPVSKTLFGRELTKHGIEPSKDSGIRYRTQVKLADEVDWEWSYPTD